MTAGWTILFPEEVIHVATRSEARNNHKGAAHQVYDSPPFLSRTRGKNERERATEYLWCPTEPQYLSRWGYHICLDSYKIMIFGKRHFQLFPQLELFYCIQNKWSVVGTVNAFSVVVVSSIKNYYYIMIMGGGWSLMSKSKHSVCGMGAWTTRYNICTDSWRQVGQRDIQVTKSIL